MQAKILLHSNSRGVVINLQQQGISKFRRKIEPPPSQPAQSSSDGCCYCDVCPLPEPCSAISALEAGGCQELWQGGHSEETIDPEI